MNDRLNSVLSRAGLALLSETGGNPLASNAVGMWSDGTNQPWLQDANGNQVQHALNRGVVPSSRLAFSANPAALDTVTIGGTTFQIVTSLGVATSSVQVKRQGTAAGTLAKLIEAINGTADAANWTEATTPFAKSVVADAVTATSLRLRLATARGGTATVGTSSSLVLAASITGGASAWSIANLNASGKSVNDTYESWGAITVTSAMITAGSIQLELPFTPTLFVCQVFSSAGVQRAYSDVTAISGNALSITLGGGASPNIQANDVLTFLAKQ